MSNACTPPGQEPVRPEPFRQPEDCPRAFCVAIEAGQKEVERLKHIEAQLRDALARERVLLDQKDELIRHKDLMSRESDHRLMNGLQMVASLLSLQSREAPNAKAADQLKIAANRVATIASVHKRLHALDHVGSVELKNYLENLCHDLKGILPGGHRNLAVEGIAVEVPTTIGVPLGYIVSELVTNSAKHADGKITIRLGMSAGGYELSVSDDGPGFPKGFDPTKSKGLGMKIVSSLVNQIGGQAIFGASPSGRGARFTVRFTLNKLSASVAESAAPKSVLSDLDDQRMPVSVSTRPMCPVCKHRMALARVSPGKRGFEERTFECSTCERTEVASFAVDPMKTDAVGWLAGELRPTR
ncbi:sensor histidine kinase [Bradyrhizobium daqingense]|uniref:histidine kinase n=1 Tax=Bradyrhizobium daqingense TaxID=993502 RepID=A0A562KHR0_9BRAD|nr:sensor histidine kinase [Bradyrhizobium daqingense]TWH94940.1 two-component sensor histidine kinase [Bradyrhizobium daqingense]UFS87701.1 sensor histidine kinase [Bradyrhizobium daqingense]